MRLSAALVACVVLSWPAAAAGQTPRAEATSAPGSTAQVVAADAAADSAVAAPGEPRPSEYVAELTREALNAHLSPGRQESGPAARSDALKARFAGMAAWTRSGLDSAARLARRPAVRRVLLPLVLLISTVVVVWRLGTSRGRSEALRAATGRIHAVYDLAEGGARVPDIARRTHVAQEGVSLAMRLADRRSQVIR